MERTYGANYISDLIAVVLTAIQTDAVFQAISMTLTIVATAFSIFLTTLRLIYWFKEAKKDGKITSEEVDEAKSIIEDGTKNHLDNK